MSSQKKKKKTADLENKHLLMGILRCAEFKYIGRSLHSLSAFLLVLISNLLALVTTCKCTHCTAAAVDAVSPKTVRPES